MAEYRGRFSRRSSHPRRPAEPRSFVEHNYHDHYHDPREEAVVDHSGSRGGVAVAFPEKLHEMLLAVEEEHLEEVISWQPHGRCFLIHQKERFVNDVMPRYVSYGPFDC